MDKLLNIIEIVGGRYVLNEDLLHSALTLAEKCDNIALISIVGPKSHGKTFFINCLINYMKSEHKEEWPHCEDALINRNDRPQNDNYIITPAIHLTSLPYIITDEIDGEVIRTAVFLMDSDSVFDKEMSSQQVQNIIALFLLTSSTVIYNHKQDLPLEEFSRLEGISSSISFIDHSLDSLKNVMFLIRDWSPETKNNKFSFGIYEGSKYIENLIENMILDKSFEDLNCFLMSAPVFDTQTEVIKLSELNKQFILDLKNSIVFKLLNIEEMLKKRRLNTNEYINSSELFKLFENCVKILNQSIDENSMFDNLITGIENLTLGDKLRAETDSCEKESKLETNASDSAIVNGLIPTCESYSYEIIGTTENSEFKTEKSLIKSLKENPANGTENSNYCDNDLIDLFDESESKVSFSSPESAEEMSNDDRDDRSFSLLEDFITEDESDDTSSSEKPNISNTCIDGDTKDSSNPLMIEKNIKILKVDSQNSSEKKNSITDENNLKNSPNRGIEEIEISGSFQCHHQNKINNNYKISGTYPVEFQSLPNICETSHRDLRKINYCDYQNNDDKRENNYKIRNNSYTSIHEETKKSSNPLMTEHNNQNEECYSEETPEKNMEELKYNNIHSSVDESSRSLPERLYPDLKSFRDSDNNYHKNIENNESNEAFVDENEIENRFIALLDDLLVEYYKNMEIKLKDQTLDLDRDLNETHETLKQKIFKTFEKRSNNFKKSLIIRDYKDKYYAKLNLKMEEAIETYKHKVQVKLNEARNQYQNLLKKISPLYKMDMKSSIMGQMRDDLHIRDLSQIQRLCKEKAFKLFKETTVKFFIGNIEIEFLRKLNEEITQIDYNFEAPWNHYRTLESERQQNFSNSKYYSNEKIKEFHENQKSRINYSVEKFNDSDMIQLAVYLLNKSFDSFEERNNFIEKKERNFAKRAMELAFQLYKDCFEAKLRTDFFEQNEVNNNRDQLLVYTMKQLIASCDFNEYQNYLIDYCRDELRLKVEEIHENKSYEYQEKVCLTKKKLTELRKEALESYCRSMKAETSQKITYLKSNEFTESHHRYSKMAIEIFNKSTEFLNEDFDTELASKVLLENQSILRKLITNEKQKFKTLNDKNTPDVHSIAIYLGKKYTIAATHRNDIYDIICDKFGQELRPNSISFGDEILIGTEAKNHYENFFPNIDSFKNFDIKQLLGRERIDVSNEELSEFPFTFLKDKLYVNVNYHDLRTDLSIETLLAFMILDIKLCAEKQIGNMSNIVLTVPTNYTINQKNSIRNAAKIAGFKDCDVISELSAAAINYAVGRQMTAKKFKDIVLFVIINDYECDVAICVITNKKIEYKVYINKSLNSTEEEKAGLLNKILNNSRKSEENDNNITKHKFKHIIEKAFKKSNFKSSVHIDECVIAGTSLLIPDIMTWINKYVNPIPSMICNSMNIIINGSAIYGQMQANKIDFIEISEVTTHNIYLDFEIKSSKEKNIEVMHKNTSLPKDKRIAFNAPKSSDLPLTITISQDNQTVITHLINELPFSDYTNHKYNTHLLDFNVDCFGQIYVMSLVSNKKQTSGLKLDSIEINPGLNEKDIVEEKQKLCSLMDKIQEKIKINEEKLCLGEAINELSCHCSNVKNEIENNLKLRPLIKKQILLEIEKTLSLLNDEHLDLNGITKQKQMLDKTLEGYKSLLQ